MPFQQWRHYLVRHHLIRNSVEGGGEHGAKAFAVLVSSQENRLRGGA
jgi:hypothetical protein